MLKFNNVKMLKTMLKLLKSTANRAGRAEAAKSDGARRQSGRQAGLIKKSACGRESNGAPNLGKMEKTSKKAAQRPDVESVHLYHIDKAEVIA